jgi:hypothetical protein
MGETLIVELTDDGMIEASLGPYRPTVHGAHTSRVSFGARPIPLYQFDERNASELIIRYLASITARLPAGDTVAEDAVRNMKRHTFSDTGFE